MTQADPRSAYASPSGYPAGPTGFDPPDGRPGRNGFGIAALLLGIVSLPGAFVPDAGLLVALAGVLMGVVGWARAGRRGLTRGAAVAGTILAGVGLAGSVMVTVAGTHASNACKHSVSNSRSYNTCRKNHFDL